MSSRNKKYLLTAFAGIVLAFLFAVIYPVRPAFSAAGFKITGGKSGAESKADNSDWHIFRGDSRLSGFSNSEIIPPLRILWRWNSGARIKSSPIINGDLIFLMNENGVVSALSAGTGKLHWRYDSGATSDASPLFYRNMIFAGNDSGLFFALHCESGKEKWKIKSRGQIKGSANIYEDNDGKAMILFGSYDFSLYAVDSSDGSILWNFKTDNYINGTPAISGGMAIFGGCDSKLRMIDLHGGNEIDSIDTGSYIPASPAISGDRIYSANFAGRIICYDMKNKKIIWEDAGEDRQIVSCPSVGEDSVVVGSKEGELFCMDRENGKLRWKFKVKASIEGDPVICGEYVIIPSSDGRLNMLNLKNGERLWSFDAGSPIASSPSVAGGKIFFCTEDGILYAIGE